MSTKNRTELKAYFEAGEKPTENQFVDFVDASINQAEDGIEKKPGEPLRITAEDLEINSKIALNAPLATSTSGKENEVFISAEENTLKLSAKEVKLSGNISMNNLSTSKTLGNGTTSDTVIASQKAVKSYIDTRLPKGLISMWSGAEIPNGWALCNGENNTPDLRGRFVVGSDKEKPAYTIGETGGISEINLEVKHLPSHTHLDKGHIHGVKDPGHNHANDEFKGGLVKDDNSNTTKSSLDGDNNNNNEFNLTKYVKIQKSSTNIEIELGKANLEHTGENHPYDNRPPFYVLAYIIKL